MLTAALALPLAACEKTENNSSENTSQSLSKTPSGTSSAVQSTHVGEENSDTPPLSVCSELKELTSTVEIHFDGAACGTENGLYYMEAPRIGSEYGHIFYIDYTTKQEIYLCSDSACKHDTERCTSSFSDSEFFLDNCTQLFVYNNSLFYLSIADSSDGTVSTYLPDNSEDKREQALYRMNLDGSNRQRIFSFDKGLAVEPFAAGDGNFLWFSVKTPVLEYNENNKKYYHTCKDSALIKVSLSDHSIVERIPIRNDLVRPTVFGCAGDKFIISATGYPDGYTEKDAMDKLAEWDGAGAPADDIDNSSYTVYYTLDHTDKKFKEVLRHGLKESCFKFTYENYMYFNSGTIMKINLENGENTGLTFTNGYTAFETFGGKLVCQSADSGDNTVYYIDIANGEITRSELKSPEDSRYGIGASIAAVGADSALIRTEQRVIPNNHGGSAGFYYGYALLPLNDLFNGIPNYEPIKIIDRG